MGHFLAAMRHGIPASLPYFLPLPISPFGTLGAVIGMDGTRANRKQMFDIGLAGPLAGLLVIVPVLWLGMRNLDLSGPAHGLVWDTPLIVRWLLNDYQPPGYHGQTYLGFSQVNAYFMAAWVGLFITALNMLPVSQLDGGHVLHALFGPRGRWISRGVVLLAVGYMAWALTPIWLLMVVLVLVIGVDHPPTRDDRVPLGWLRFGLGLISLLIPVLCLPPTVYKVLTNAEATTASAPLDPLGTVPGGGGRENRGVDIVKTTLPDRAGSLH
jgi:membrane-associated protease RseP (regulator of RpoE activity)